MGEDDWRGWKNGKYDNRYRGLKRHSGKRGYKIPIITSIIIGVIILGYFVYQTYGIPQPIQDEASKIITNTTHTIQQISSQDQQSISTQKSIGVHTINATQTEPAPATIFPRLPKHSTIPCQSGFTMLPDGSCIINYGKFNPAPTSARGLAINPNNFSLVVLNDINNYRTQNGVGILSLNNNIVSQTYAELLLSEKCIHHMNDNGLTPQGRFHQAGIDSFTIGENVAGGNVGDLGSEFITYQGFIGQEDYQMMYNDSSSNWGHKANILNPHYTSISVGVAFDDNNEVIVEDFESPLQSNEYIPSSAYFDTPDQKECW